MLIGSPIWYTKRPFSTRGALGSASSGIWGFVIMSFKALKLSKWLSGIFSTDAAWNIHQILVLPLPFFATSFVISSYNNWTHIDGLWEAIGFIIQYECGLRGPVCVRVDVVHSHVPRAVQHQRYWIRLLSVPVIYDHKRRVGIRRVSTSACVLHGEHNGCKRSNNFWTEYIYVCSKLKIYVCTCSTMDEFHYSSRTLPKLLRRIWDNVEVSLDWRMFRHDQILYCGGT